MSIEDEVAADLFAARLSSTIITGSDLAELVKAVLAVAYLRGSVAGSDSVLAEWRKHLDGKQ